MQAILETERLFLREFSENDYQGLCEILQDKDVMYAYEHPFSDDEVKSWYKRLMIDHYKKHGFGLWLIVHKETKELLGQCGLTIQIVNGEEYLEIGYHLKKKHWHKGYAAEAALGCKKYAFKVLKASNVYSIIRHDNIASQNIAKRIGMKKIREEMKHYFNKDILHYIYGIKNTEILMDIKQKETIEAYDNSAKDFEEKIGSIKNYNTTYDYILGKLKKNNNVLDLACGPCQIGKYIKEKINVNITGVDLSREMLKIAQNNIPDGIFLEDSIVTFKNNIFYDLVIIGFGIPYLNKEQVKKCIKNSVALLKIKGCLYVSFMDGNKEGFEKTSFGGNNKYYIYYHEKEMVRKILTENAIHIEKEYILDYNEPDGRITNDVIYIGVKDK